MTYIQYGVHSMCRTFNVTYISMWRVFNVTCIQCDVHSMWCAFSVTYTQSDVYIQFDVLGQGALDPYNEITWLLKIERIFCPRKLFLGKNSSPEKSLQNIRSIFCLEYQSCDRRKNQYYNILVTFIFKFGCSLLYSQYVYSEISVVA